MKIFQDLDIRGTAEAIEQVADQIEAILTAGWCRDKEAESDPIWETTGGKAFCFPCSRTDTRPSAKLWLFKKTELSMRVTNIVPQEVGQISMDEYNAILREFHGTFVGPVAAELGLEVTISEEHVDITKWISEEAAKKLHFFSVAANKSTGSSHPLDQERWFAFITAVHSEGSELDASTVARWLEEEEGWSNDKAHELACEYETAMDLLKYYDSHQ